ncbi:adenylyl cyclase-associated protein 2-like, partial [Limulus polyphemus]|uniref:Adenylyl cyclase-associated protein 2-like n=1 Tax=Limulus polyphemus TaxID=6850 RepID=A0ABM1T372_LIMPO
MRNKAQILVEPPNYQLIFLSFIGGCEKARYIYIFSKLKVFNNIVLFPQNVLISLLKPTSDQIQAVQDFRQKNRASTYFNHLSAVSESIPALGWVTVAPAPAPYVKEMLDAGQFYTNRVLMDYKDKEKTHVDWARNWLQFLNDLQAYIKKYHTTGLSWNSSVSTSFVN